MRGIYKIFRVRQLELIKNAENLTVSQNFQIYSLKQEIRDKIKQGKTFDAIVINETATINRE